MNKQEFDERIGRESSQEEFDKANQAYMITDVDKDIFCEMWKNLRDDAKKYIFMMCQNFHNDVKKSQIEYCKLMEENVETKVELNGVKESNRNAIDMLEKKDRDLQVAHDLNASLIRILGSTRQGEMLFTMIKSM